jgi:hypothetical protein
MTSATMDLSGLRGEGVGPSVDVTAKVNRQVTDKLQAKTTSLHEESVKKLDSTPTPKDKPNVSHKVELYMEGETALMCYTKTPMLTLVHAKTPMRMPENSLARYRVTGV